MIWIECIEMMIYPNNLSSKKEDPIYLLIPQPHAFCNKEESQRPQAKMEKKELILLLKGSAAVVCRSDGPPTCYLFIFGYWLLLFIQLIVAHQHSSITYQMHLLVYKVVHIWIHSGILELMSKNYLVGCSKNKHFYSSSSRQCENAC